MSRPASPHRLSGVRLGAQERWVLLHAPDPTASVGLQIGGDTAAQRESRNRATRKLANLGLLDRLHASVTVPSWGPLYVWQGTFWRNPTEPTRTVRSVMVWRTPFGTEITSRYFRELASGQPIRWDPQTVEQASLAGQPINDHHRYHREQGVRTRASEQRDDERYRGSPQPREAVPANVRSTKERAAWEAVLSLVLGKPEDGDAELLWATARAMYDGAYRTDIQRVAAALQTR